MSFEPGIKKVKILICGTLPPPNFGHSMLYRTLMDSKFSREFDIVFFDMKFWSYEKHKRITAAKLAKFVVYYFQFIGRVISARPRYVLYAVSFDKIPLLKDLVFCLTAKVLGRKVILHDMGQYVAELYRNSGPGMRKWVKLITRMADASIVLGETTRKVYEGFMPLDKVFAVPAAVSDSAGISVAGVPPPNAGIVNILFFSFLQESKGVWTAVRAVPLVAAQNANVHFTFAGPVESENLLIKIKDFIRANNCENRFEYAGYISDDKQRSYLYRQCDIYIFPTLRDVFGLVLLHAMAEKKPVIASREGAVPEIVDDGETGILIPKGDEQALAQRILELAKDAGLRHRMGQAGRAKYERMYTLEKYADRMICVFKTFETEAALN